ncbi:MAG: 2Fe-2S iron-sulfur cluster binding domain-containing protein [Lentisphaeria bacterium]
MTLFFTAVGILCGICGVLAAALVIADRYFNDYGICNIDINEGSKVLEVDGGESLLGTLGGQKIFIPSACGGRGSCGLCKLKVKTGGGQVLPTEEPHLSKEEIADNVRLSCQMKVRGDMEIEIPEELFNIREYEAVAEKITDLTHDIKLLRIKLSEPEEISFTPGQYIQLECPPYKMNPEAVYRAYSIASDPVDKDHLDLIIRLVPEGICTTWVFDFLEEGESLTLNGPYGDFYIRPGNSEMIFIAGGSGMAPFRSILADLERQECKRPIRYFFGALTAKDLFMLDEMKGYEERLYDFKFIPALSEPVPDDEWNGETGLITEVVAAHYPDCSDKQGYLCGSPGMIDACIKVLDAGGMDSENIFYDKFA